MPWSGGIYSRGYPSWSNDAANNLPISATKFDTEDNDFATGLNNCITKDGLSGPTAPLSWSQTASQPLALTRGSDGNVFSIGRTGGTNNPVLTFSVADVAGPQLTSSSGNITALANAGNWGFAVKSAGSGTEYGLVIQAGAASTDHAFRVTNLAQSAQFFDINGVGTITAGPAIGGQTLALTGAANSWTQQITGSATSGQSYGLLVNGGTTSADYALLVRTQSGTNLLTISGDGHGSIASVSAGAIFSWSAAGNFTVSPANSGNTLAVTGVSSGYATALYGATSGIAYGLSIASGLSSTDYNLVCNNSAGNVAFMRIFGDGGMTLGSPTGGNLGIGYLNVQNGVRVNNIALASTTNPTFTGTVTIPTVTPSTDNTTKAASTAFVQSVVGISSGSNGNGYYRNNPDGSITQWGLMSGGPSHTYPVAYSTVGSINITLGAQGGVSTSYVSSYNTTSFTLSSTVTGMFWHTEGY